MTRRDAYRGTYRRGLAVGIGCLLSLLLVALIEAVLFVLNAFVRDELDGEEPYLFEFSEALGYKPLANAKGRAVKTHNEETLYDVVYRTDGRGRRITPPAGAAAPDKFVVFFGGSYTFGHGLPDHETLPAMVQQRMPEARVYNYGFVGYGPQQALVKIRSGELPNEIPEPGGTAVYVFMGHHIQRAIGSMRVWSQWGRHFPYFTLNANGKLVHRESFLRGRPVRSRIYEVLKHEQVMQFFHMDIPMRTTHDHIRLTAAILAETRQAFLHAYPDGRFVTLMYPASPQLRFDRERFVEALTERHVTVLDFSRLIDLQNERYHIPYDGHPTAAAHEAVAEALVARLHHER